MGKEYSRIIFLVGWKSEELHSFVKYIGQSEKEVENWAIDKMQAGLKSIQALEKKKVELLTTDLGQVFVRQQEERKKY